MPTHHGGGNSIRESDMPSIHFVSTVSAGSPVQSAQGRPVAQSQIPLDVELRWHENYKKVYDSELVSKAPVQSAQVPCRNVNEGYAARAGNTVGLGRSQRLPSKLEQQKQAHSNHRATNYGDDDMTDDSMTCDLGVSKPLVWRADRSQMLPDICSAPDSSIEAFSNQKRIERINELRQARGAPPFGKQSVQARASVISYDAEDLPASPIVSSIAAKTFENDFYAADADSESIVSATHIVQEAAVEFQAVPLEAKFDWEAPVDVVEEMRLRWLRFKNTADDTADCRVNEHDDTSWELNARWKQSVGFENLRPKEMSAEMQAIVAPIDFVKFEFTVGDPPRREELPPVVTESQSPRGHHHNVSLAPSGSSVVSLPALQQQPEGGSRNSKGVGRDSGTPVPDNCAQQ
jgi:hypothetical protein